MSAQEETAGCGAVAVNHQHEGSSPSSSTDEVLTVEDAAKFLRIGKSQLYEALGRGDIPHRRIGKTYRLSRTALVIWLGGETPCSAPRKAKR